LWTDYLTKCSRFFNAWFILIFFVVVMATASSTNKTPRSNNAEKVINSLEKTLGRKLDKLITVVNASSRGKPNVGPGIFCQGLIQFKINETSAQVSSWYSAPGWGKWPRENLNSQDSTRGIDGAPEKYGKLVIFYEAQFCTSQLLYVTFYLFTGSTFASCKAAFTRQTKVCKLVLANFKKLANSCLHTSNSRQLKAHANLQHGRHSPMALAAQSCRLCLTIILC